MRPYTAWLTGSILLALGVILWRAARRDRDAAVRWLDVGVAAVIGGVFGARLLHVALNWDYFADHTGEITRLSAGGLEWHGALLVGIPAALVMARLRRVLFVPWTDAAALAWPVGLAGAWIACRGAGCGYGYEVHTLADWPGWMVAELPDIYGTVAPRLDVQLGGALWGGVLLAVALLFTWRGWLAGVRVWLVFALTGLGMALLAFFRADPAQTIYHHRADQVFDLLLVLLSTVTGSIIWLSQRRAAHPAHDQDTHTEGKPYEIDTRTGTDHSEAG